jgi:hypothetical protein
MVKNFQKILLIYSYKIFCFILINLQKNFLISHEDLKRYLIEDLLKISKRTRDEIFFVSTMSFIYSTWIVRRFVKDLSEIFEWDIMRFGSLVSNRSRPWSSHDRDRSAFFNIHYSNDKLLLIILNNLKTTKQILFKMNYDDFEKNLIGIFLRSLVNLYLISLRDQLKIFWILFEVLKINSGKRPKWLVDFLIKSSKIFWRSQKELVIRFS